MTAFDINEKLFRLYGREQLTDKVKYRLVRSEEQTEKRYGNYDLYTQEGGIYLGNRTGLQEIKKYWYMKACWLLERVEANKNRDDLIHEKYTYEPIFPFLDAKDNPLPLEWKPIEFMINRMEKAERHFLTEEDHRQIEENKQLEKEDKMMAILDQPDPVKELPTFKASSLLVDTARIVRQSNPFKLNDLRRVQ